MQATFPRVVFLRALSTFKQRRENFSQYVHVLLEGLTQQSYSDGRQRNVLKNVMHVQRSCFAHINTNCFLTLLLSSSSSLLKVPFMQCGGCKHNTFFFFFSLIPGYWLLVIGFVWVIMPLRWISLHKRNELKSAVMAILHERLEVLHTSCTPVILGIFKPLH